MSQLTVPELIVKIDEFLATEPLTEILNKEVWFKYKLQGVGYDYDINDDTCEDIPEDETCLVAELALVLADSLSTASGYANFIKHQELADLSNGKYKVETDTLFTDKGLICFG